MQAQIHLYMRITLSILALLFCLMPNQVFAQQEEAGSPEVSKDNQLLIAADAGDTAKVSKLIKMGADVDATTWDGVTALMYATQNRNLDMMELLIRCGANPDIKPDNGFTALLTAIRNGQPEPAEFLIRNGASVDIPDKYKMTPLMHAIVADSFYMADMLLYYGAAIDSRRRDGVNALMLASWLGNQGIAERLIQAGADVNTTDNMGRTPLHFASMAGHQDIMELLIGEGAMIEARTTSGYTPLSMTIVKNDFLAARLLIGSGANVNSRINNSLNPLTLAIDNRNDTLAAMLRKNEAKASPWPWFDKIIFGSHFTFNPDDMFVGFSLGLSDKKYNLWSSLAYDFRPKSIRIMEPDKGSNYFQYWESRHLISISVDKAFWLLTGKKGFKAGLAAGFEESMVFGNYRGSALGPENRLLFSPHAGAVVQSGSFRIRFNYAFRDQHLAEMSKNWYTVSLDLLFNRHKRSLNQYSITGL